MKINTLHIYIIILLAFLGSSCNKLSPAGFWTNYEKELIKEKYSNQGPWGGKRYIHWQANDNHFFDLKNMFEFANDNGWHLIDTIMFSSEDLKRFTKNNKPSFPFTYTDFNDPLDDNQFPRWIITDATLYRFTTGWVAIEPGNLNSTEFNGYLLVNDKENEVTIYHLWGE